MRPRDRLRHGRVAGLVALWLACAAAAGQPSLADADAMARAQRAADHVKELILQSAQLRNPAASASAPAPARAPAPRPARAGAGAGAGAVAKTPVPTVKPATVREPEAPPAEPSTAPPPTAQSVTIAASGPTAAPPTPRQPIALFDFEDSIEGFELHRAADWLAGGADALRLTTMASHGQSALQAQAADDSWFGVELTESVDFTAVHRVVFHLHSARGAPARFAMKTGSQYDWCELKAVARGGGSGDLVRYEVELKATGSKDCRKLDLEDVRGLQWGLRGGDSVVVDQVELL